MGPSPGGSLLPLSGPGVDLDNTEKHWSVHYLRYITMLGPLLGPQGDDVTQEDRVLLQRVLKGPSPGVSPLPLSWPGVDLNNFKHWSVHYLRYMTMLGPLCSPPTNN